MAEFKHWHVQRGAAAGVTSVVLQKTRVESMIPHFLPAMPKQLFPFDPIPHEQNKMTDVNGEVVLGRWATSTEDGTKVRIMIAKWHF
jgi:hypothetical protein